MIKFKKWMSAKPDKTKKICFNLKKKVNFALQYYYTLG